MKLSFVKHRHPKERFEVEKEVYIHRHTQLCIKWCTDRLWEEKYSSYWMFWAFTKHKPHKNTRFFRNWNLKDGVTTPQTAKPSEFVFQAPLHTMIIRNTNEKPTKPRFPHNNIAPGTRTSRTTKNLQDTDSTRQHISQTTVCNRIALEKSHLLSAHFPCLWKIRSCH